MRPSRKPARILYLPPYSPEFDLIEQILAKLKALLRTAAARTVPDMWAAIREAFSRFTPDECRNSLTAAGYANDLAVATSTVTVLAVSRLRPRCISRFALGIAKQLHS